MLKGFGPKKLAEYKVKSISTVEELARLKPDGLFALAVTGRTGATQQIREEALRTVRGHVALAQAFLIGKNRWPPPANEAAPAAAAAAPAEAAAAPAAAPAAPAAAPSAALPASAAPAASVGDFGDYAQRDGYHGVRISATLVDDVAFTACESLEPYLKAIILNTLSPNGIWKLDHTFRYMKSVVAANPAGHRSLFYPFGSFASVMNEYAQPMSMSMWYGILTSSTVGDLEPHLKGLLDRHRRLYLILSGCPVQSTLTTAVTGALPLALAIALTLKPSPIQSHPTPSSLQARQAASSIPRRADSVRPLPLV